jgi:hypothetical protein
METRLERLRSPRSIKGRPLLEVDPALLDHLAQVFPPDPPSLDESLERLRYRAGQLSVVRHLREMDAAARDAREA